MDKRISILTMALILTVIMTGIIFDSNESEKLNVSEKKNMEEIIRNLLDNPSSLFRYSRIYL